MICSVTGHRPAGFPFPREDNGLYREYRECLSSEVRKLILLGYTSFLTGMAEGADIDFALTVLAHKTEYSDIVLEAVLPYQFLPTKKRTVYHETRDFILERCDCRYVLSDHYYRGCMDHRNRFMVDKSDLVLAVWNGNEQGGTWNTIRYARRQKKEIHYIML